MRIGLVIDTGYIPSTKNLHIFLKELCKKAEVILFLSKKLLKEYEGRGVFSRFEQQLEYKIKRLRKYCKEIRIHKQRFSLYIHIIERSKLVEYEQMLYQAIKGPLKKDIKVFELVCFAARRTDKAFLLTLDQEILRKGYDILRRVFSPDYEKIAIVSNIEFLLESI
ncbi:MAG: hypothetical protein ACTSVA_03060 [Candidatus Njordarchaeales archaeon]